MQYDTAETKVKKVLPLNSGGNLIIAERGWILESLDGVDESWGDQAIPIELDDQLAWLLYRDGEVIITITDDDIDAADPMEGGSTKLTDPLSLARNTPAGGILNLFGSAMSMLRPQKDRGFFSRWASEGATGSTDRKMSRAIADVQQEVDTLSIEESAYDEDDDVESAPAVTPAATSAAAAPAKEEKAKTGVPDDDDVWVAARREGVLLVNEARSKMMAGMLSETVEAATAAMAIFTAEEKRGVAAASEQRVRAQQILSDAATAQAGQTKAREEAVRLAGEAKEWLQTGDLDQALMLAEKAQEALQEVEKCYGRVTASELTTVLEIRVRAEEKAQMRREAKAAAKDQGPEAQAATRKREEAEKRQQSKLAAKKKEEARKIEAGEAPAAPAPAKEEAKELEEWREAKSLGASLNRGARLALKAGQLDEAFALAQEAASAFKVAAAKGYRKGDAEVRACRSLAERAQLARDATRAGTAGGQVVKERREKTAGRERSEENEELAALFAVEAYGASQTEESKEGKEDAAAKKRQEEEAKRREEEEAQARAEEERVRAEAEAKKRVEEERRRKEEEAEKLKAEADALYRAMASKKQQAQAAEAMADAEKTLAKWIEAEEEQARAEEEARMRAEAEARAKEVIEAKKREEEEAKRREEEEKKRVEAAAQREQEEAERAREAAEGEATRAEKARKRAQKAERERLADQQLPTGLAPFPTGELVEAMFYEDRDWYQARVLTQEIGGKQWVLFVDYGDEQETKVSDMRFPPGLAPPSRRPPAAPPAPTPEPLSATPPPLVSLRAPPRPSPELKQNAGRQGSMRQGSLVGAAVEGTQTVSFGAGGEPLGEKRYEMPVKYHGVLLGKQGLTVKAMQKASGAQIRFEKEPIGAIVIKGTDKQREEAWKLVKGMQATLPMLLTKLRSDAIEEGELMSRPNLRGRIEDKQAVWPVAVSEAIARVREDSVQTND